MSSSNELDRFREKWKRELKHQVPVLGDNSGNTVNSVEPGVDYCRDNYLPASNSILVDPQLIDDASQDTTEAEDKIAKSSSSNIPDSGEYYPFKILTQFLNEAPKQVRVKRNRTELMNNGLTYKKRTYFSSTSEGNTKKKPKEEKLSSQAEHDSSSSKKMLDIFIADLDEISEIPFFDTTLPREVALKIFQHLDMKSLCSCSQVSHSWHGLADDELLWFRICHELGYDTNFQINEQHGWKNKLKQHIEQEQLLKANWKARIGKPYNLNFARGGILCAVHSYGSTVVAGYTSCNVRSWDTKTGDVCTFNASNTALVLDENAEDFGRIHNEIMHVASTESITAASFKHGFVDVWCNEESVDPVHTLTFNNTDVTSLSVQDVKSHYSLVAASQATRVQVHSVVTADATCLNDFHMNTAVSQLDWYSTCPSDMSSHLLITTHSSVWLKKLNLQPSWCGGSSSKHDQDLTEVHNIIWAPITTVGLRSSSDEIAVGFNLYTGPSTQIKVNIYDVTKNHVKATLTGHTWVISCIHLPDSLTNQLVTGSGDRKIRLYDLRVASFAAMTLVGHAAKVTSVEMDDWKVVSGDEGGFVCVWDQRMSCKLWDVHNRHPVHYCHFDDRLLIIGNIPYQKFPETDEFETVSSLRYRGTVQVYDFLANQQTQGIPDICLSSYSEPEGYDYNIGLTVPYDAVN